MSKHELPLYKIKRSRLEDMKLYFSEVAEDILYEALVHMPVEKIREMGFSYDEWSIFVNMECSIQWKGINPDIWMEIEEDVA